MKTYSITITMHDGSTDRVHGIYSDGFEAVIQIMEHFPEACRISARRIA